MITRTRGVAHDSFRKALAIHKETFRSWAFTADDFLLWLFFYLDFLLNGRNLISFYIIKFIVGIFKFDGSLTLVLGRVILRSRDIIGSL